MKRLLLLFFISFSLLFADGFTKMATIKPELVQSGKKKMWCPICGMSLKKFYKTSHSATTKSGEKRQYCSMRCLLVDMQKSKIDKNSIKVVDVTTQKFIPVKDAFYVVGSKIKGTMSKISKIAFGKKEDALNFIKKYGGKLMNFNEALEVAKKGLSKDIAMINMKKQKMVYPKGEMLYKKKCKAFKIDFSKFKDINELKAYIVDNNLCKIKGKPLQMVTLYLWEVKRVNSNREKIAVSKDKKCPVCGMFVYKYPKWVALIKVKSHSFYFDGVKDMMKFYFNPKKYLNVDFTTKEIKKLYVTDYYTLNKIEAQKAFFVIKSDVTGPMGNELIPFKSKESALSFIKDHSGKIVTFNQINLKLIESM